MTLVAKRRFISVAATVLACIELVSSPQQEPRQRRTAEPRVRQTSPEHGSELGPARWGEGKAPIRERRRRCRHRPSSRSS